MIQGHPRLSTITTRINDHSQIIHDYPQSSTMIHILVVTDARRTHVLTN
jgi:hypothetical protein